MKRGIVGLYAIADTRYLDDTRLIPAARAAIEGGAKIIQYRDKSDDVARREKQALALAALCRETNVLFILNDDIALAQRSGADGVHLGRDDAALALARAALGANAVIGVSCYNEWELAQRAQTQGANYVAFGSFFPSRTKPNAVRADLSLLEQARRSLGVPAVAIGGITPENAPTLIEAGASAIAVIEGLFGAGDVRATAARYATLFT
jgi:thiamine-phosphate pyrophosphorylase